MAAKALSLSVVLGYVVLLALVLVGIALAKVTQKISAIVFITTIGANISSLWFFGAEALNDAVKTVDFLCIATVMLTLAGLPLGNDIPLLKNIGSKIIPVGLVAIKASFLLSTVIAEFALGLWHWVRCGLFLEVKRSTSFLAERFTSKCWNISTPFRPCVIHRLSKGTPMQCGRRVHLRILKEFHRNLFTA